MYKIESIENQRKAILPMNDISATIFYNQRFIISAPIPEPLAWRLTKTEDISPKGVRRLTFAQDRWDQHKDYIERDEFGNIVGMYADWFQSEVEPVSVLPTDTPTPSPTTTATITCSGKQQIRIGGSAKTFTVTFTDEDGTSIDTLPGTWEFSIDGESVPKELLTLTVIDNRVKVKFLGDDSYIGKILTVTYKVDDEDITTSLPIEIIAL